MKKLGQILFIALLILPFQLGAKGLGDKNKIEEGEYYYSITVEGSYDEVYERLKTALKKVEFGIVSENKMNETINEKLGTSIPTYVVLGICNPKHAHSALQVEDNIGLMLPCKGLIRLVEEGKYVVALQNPIKTLQVVENPKMDEIGKKVAESFKEALATM